MNLTIKRLGGLIAACIVFVGLIGCESSPSQKPSPRTSNGYATVLANNAGAIATVQPLATTAAENAFAAGGNAIDAALAAAFTLGVVDSHNSGIGGGCFIVARLSDGRIIALDGREMAPAAAHRDMYVVNGEVQSGLSKTGALAAGIPGSVAALHQLQQMAGKLSFSDVLLPAADIAETGFAIDNTLALRLERTADRLALFEASKAIYLHADGTPLKRGEKLVQQDLANSYRELAKHGPNWFYQGAFAGAVARYMQKAGGIITKDDFANYHVIQREPVKASFKGFDVYGFGPPSSGGVHIAQMLNMLAGDDLAGMEDAERYHLLIEVMKLAFADRAHWLGDADFVNVPKGLIDSDYAKRLRETITEGKAAGDVTYGMPPNAAKEFFYRALNKHTTHLTTADSEGNWVAITTTINTSFGSKVVVPGTGVLLNNQMDDFVAAPKVANAFGLVGDEANAIAPGKRPLSSMSPTLVVKNGEPVLTLGAAGGPTIITQVVQGLVNYLALHKPLEQAIDTPRVHHQWQPNKVFTEIKDKVLLEALTAMGHQLQQAGDFGGTQAISFRDGQFEAVADPRVLRRNSAE